MRRNEALILAIVLLLSSAFGDDKEAPADAERKKATPLLAMQQPVRVAAGRAITDGTLLSVVLTREIDVKRVKPGDPVPLVLEHDLWHRDLLIGKAGTPVEAVITEAKTAKAASQGSKLTIEIKRVKLLNGQQLPLRGAPSYSGGSVGPVGQITGGFVSEAAKDGCLLCEIPLVPLALFSLLLPGTTHNPKAGTVASVWTNGEIVLDATSFHVPEAAGKAKVRIVRGWVGAVRSREIYCNGVPLARLRHNRKIELEVEPGWYRFAINPEKDFVEAFVPAGQVRDFITDHDHVYFANQNLDVSAKELPKQANKREANRKINASASLFGKQKSEEKFVDGAKQVEAEDTYAGECHPLAVEVVPGVAPGAPSSSTPAVTMPGGSAPSAPSTPEPPTGASRSSAPAPPAPGPPSVE